MTTGDSIEGGLLIADMDDITPKIYIAGQYNVNKNIGLSLFWSHIFGKKVDSAEEFADMFDGVNVDSYSDLTSLHDESATFDTPAVTAYGLSLTWYFW